MSDTLNFLRNFVTIIPGASLYEDFGGEVSANNALGLYTLNCFMGHWQIEFTRAGSREINTIFATKTESAEDLLFASVVFQMLVM